MTGYKKYNTKQAVAKSVAKFNSKNGYKNPIAWQVVNDYLRIVKDSVLNGDEWLFPNGLRLVISRKKNKNKLKCLNKKTVANKLILYDLNYTYSITASGNVLDKYKYNFKASSSFRKEFRDNIKNNVANKYITK